MCHAANLVACLVNWIEQGQELHCLIVENRILVVPADVQE